MSCNEDAGRWGCSGLQGMVNGLLVVFDEAITMLAGPSRPASASAGMDRPGQDMLDDDLDLMPQAAPRCCPR